MQIIADLHLHSKYARACSKKLDLNGLSQGARIKGMQLLATGDFLHPLWQNELKAKLKEKAKGIYEYDGINYVLSGEVSLVYTQGGHGRRIHHVILAPDFEVLAQITDFFASKGRMDYDGRPIFGLSSISMCESLMQISKDIEIIPAHIWTPWFAIFGSMSGFDSVEECFEDQAKHIHALETGMSSDPAMNWRLSSLDKYTLVSNSDAHSMQPHRLGREANVFDFKELTYDALIGAIRTRKNFSYTIEVDPNYGKYHFDGHRKCSFSCSPQESKRLGDKCPKCKDKLVIGVLNRVEQLADRPEGFVPKDAVPFKSLLPLAEVIGIVTGVGVASKRVQAFQDKLIKEFNGEFNVLLNASAQEIARHTNEKIAEAVLKNREGKIKVIPGYDGEYGKPVLDNDLDNENGKVKKGLQKFAK